MKTLVLSFLTVSFAISLHAQKTYIPDDVFEQKLIELGYDSGPLDDSVLTANINTITILEIDTNQLNVGIEDLTGIEDFTALIELNCNGHQLTQLDVSNNLALETLKCRSNALTSLDVSNNLALKHLNVNENQITNLDVSNNALLQHLYCYNNQLSDINVSQNTQLLTLGCTGNPLQDIDVSDNLLLTRLYCSNNQLSVLDVSNNQALQHLECALNNLTVLDVSGNTNLKALRCWSNQLTGLNLQNSYNAHMTTIVCHDNPDLSCIQVDDVSFSDNNWITVGMEYSFAVGTVFSENCMSTLGTEESSVNAAHVYPNPVTDIINIHTEEFGTYSVYSASGRELILKGILKQGTNTFDLSGMDNGMYMLTIHTASGVTTKKIMKQ